VISHRTRHLLRIGRDFGCGNRSGPSSEASERAERALIDADQGPFGVGVTAALSAIRSANQCRPLASQPIGGMGSCSPGVPAGVSESLHDS
jgi:hypothetical protein